MQKIIEYATSIKNADKSFRESEEYQQLSLDEKFKKALQEENYYYASVYLFRLSKNKISRDEVYALWDLVLNTEIKETDESKDPEIIYHYIFYRLNVLMERSKFTFEISEWNDKPTNRVVIQALKQHNDQLLKLFISVIKRLIAFSIVFGLLAIGCEASAFFSPFFVLMICLTVAAGLSVLFTVASLLFLKKYYNYKNQCLDFKGCLIVFEENILNKEINKEKNEVEHENGREEEQEAKNEFKKETFEDYNISGSTGEIIVKFQPN